MTPTRAGAALAGTGTLIRLILRRDRIRLPIWTLAPMAMAVPTYRAYEDLYATAELRAELSATASASPAITLLYGPPYDLSTSGGFTVWRVGVFLAILLAIFAILTVVRHTRAEEDTGRADLLASGVVSRYAPLGAALAVVTGTSALAGLLIALAMIGLGAPAAGSFAFGAAAGSVGLVFAGVAAVTAQLASFARTASGMGMAALGVAFLVRGYGDSTGREWLSWLSPLGWASQVRPFAGDRWLVLALPVITAAALIAVAGVLVQRRDVGLGLIAPRQGRPDGSAALSGAFGLAWRLQRGTLTAWLATYAVMGLVLGGLAGAIGDLLGDNPDTVVILERMGGVNQLSVLYVAALMPIFGAISLFYGVGSILRARTEETEGRLEPLLATPLSRVRWLASHAALAIGGTALLLTVGGLATSVSAMASAPDSGLTVGDVLAGALIQITPAALVVAVAAVVVGVAPRFAALAWAVTGLVFVLTWIGPALGLSDRVLDLSPFAHLPHVPGESVTAAPLLILGALSAALLGVAAAGLRRRDVG